MTTGLDGLVSMVFADVKDKMFDRALTEDELNLISWSVQSTLTHLIDRDKIPADELAKLFRYAEDWKW
jgi:hypothetical protein